MKKKLIAIVTSLAMVATMVPATGFAATAGTYAADQQTAFKNALSTEPLATEVVKATPAYASYAKNMDDAIVSAVNAYDNLGATDVTALDGDTSGFVATYTDVATVAGSLKQLLSKLWTNRATKANTTDFGAIGATSLDGTQTEETTSPNIKAYLDDAALFAAVDTDAAIFRLLDAAKTTGNITDNSNGLKQANTTPSTDAKTAAATYARQSADLKTALKLMKDVKDARLDLVTAQNITEAKAREIKEFVSIYGALDADVIAKLDDTLEGHIDATGGNARALANAYLAGQSALEDFASKVNAIPTPITSYNDATDKAVKDAYAAYVDLYTADPVAEAALHDPKNVEGYDLYKAFTSAIEDQWNVRLTAWKDAITAVTPVLPDGSKYKINAVETLKDYTNTVFNDTATKGLVAALTDAKLVADKDTEAKLNTIEAKRASVKSEANVVLTEIPQPVVDLVLAIDALEEVNGSNYDTILTTISSLKKDYLALGVDDATKAAQQKRVGNYTSVLLAKEETAEKFKKEVLDTKALIEAIEEELGGTDPNYVLTKDEITAYTNAYNKAKEAYDALDAGQQEKVDALTGDALEDANDTIKAYNHGLDNEIAAEKKMSTLPTGHNPEDALTVAEAWYAYYKVLTNETPVGKLTKLADGFQDNIKPQLKDRLDLAKTTAILALKDNGKVDKANVEKAVAPVQALIAALPATMSLADEDALNEAKAAYTAITTAYASDIPVSDEIKKALTDDKKALDAAEKQIDSIVAANKPAIDKFIYEVAKIKESKATTALETRLKVIDESNTVNADYRNFTKSARALYDALTDEQKAIVQSESKKITNALLAYEKLLVAEKNVAAAMKLDEVAALIKAVPNAATLNVKDADAVAKVKAAQEAYEALTAGVKTQLVNNKFITQTQLDNYLKAVKKVTDAESKVLVTDVINSIKALTTLPTKFSNQTEVNAAYTLLTAAEEGYNKLTKAQQAEVTNAGILAKYRTDFDRLMKVYASDLYKKAAALDPNAALTPEDIAVIAELKAYVEGGYIETKNITGFDQKVYDALIALVDDNAALENATIADIPAVTYTGAEQKPAVTVTDKSGKEVPADAYEVTYSNNKDAGTALVTVSALTGKGYTGVTSKSFTINPASIKTAKAAKIANQIYNKKAKTPAVSVTAGSEKLVKDADYTVKYTNNTNIGKATVTITGTENYTGTITTTFIITPAKGKITSLKAGKKQITVSYEAQKASGKTGYYLVYSPAKGKAKTTTSTATKKTIKGLKSGTSYKVKVRAYKTIGGKKYYGKYSDVKKVKVK